MADTVHLNGGCLCGAIRYEIREIFDAGYCHCSICRRLSGAPAVLWANLPSRAFGLVAGSPRGFQSSEAWTRYFCGECGGPVYQQVSDPPGDGSDLLCVLVPTLDTPEQVQPRAHIWCGSKLAFFETDDELPRFPKGELTPPR